MSRSYKKNPIRTDGKAKSTKKSKRFANKKVRNCKGIIFKKGKNYKKLFESYNIHDYIIYWSWDEAKSEYEADNSYWKKRYKTLKEFYRYWYTCMKRK